MDVSCAAAATADDLLVFSVAMTDMLAAVARISAREVATVSSTVVAWRSDPPVSVSIAAWRRSFF